MTGFSSRVRLLVRTRAGGGDPHDACCEACGIWLGLHGGQMQHRASRGMGGSSDPATNSVVNAALLCGTPFDLCHGNCERRDEGMRLRGFWLRAGDKPAETPLILLGGCKVWLTPEGGYSDDPPAEVAA